MLRYIFAQRVEIVTLNDDMISIAEAVRIIEALIFASAEPVPKRTLQNYVSDDAMLSEILHIISTRFDDTSGIALVQVGDAFAFRTQADVAARLNVETPVERPLSRAALEVLAIIAYHQPVTRAEIEEIRGISLSRGTMDILLELGWIKPRGRRRTPGRPLTWGTSPVFLDHFGLSDIADLPGVDELRSTGLLRKGQMLGGLGEGLNDLDPDGDVSDEVSDETLFSDETDWQPHEISDTLEAERATQDDDS